MVLISTTLLGMIFAKNKADRVKQLRSTVTALHMLEIEIKFAFSLLPDALLNISKMVDDRTGELFSNTARLISDSKVTACEAWKTSVGGMTPYLCLNREDREVLAGLGNSLGQVDSENQLKSLRLVAEQLKQQELKAEDERRKVERLFRSLGVLTGMAIVIVLF